MSVETTFNNGDWIVHKHHGIGQVKGTRSSNISGEPTTYYELETSDSIVWVPQEQLTEDLLRPIATSAEIDEVIDVLQRPPKKMESHFNARKSRIHRVQRSNMLVSIARLLRDLYGRQQRRGSLSNTEQSAQRSLTKRLVQEWAIARGISVQKVEQRLSYLLQRRWRNRETKASAAMTPAMQPLPQQSVS